MARLSSFTQSILHAWRWASLVIGLCLAQPAVADDWAVNGHVVMIEPTFIPDALIFWIDVAAGNCAAVTQLAWQIRGADTASRVANVQAVLATLMTALTTGKTIYVQGDNAGCVVKYIHLNSN